jgi:hypothetical protein
LGSCKLLAASGKTKHVFKRIDRNVVGPLVVSKMMRPNLLPVDRVAPAALLLRSIPEIVDRPDRRWDVRFFNKAIADNAAILDVFGLSGDGAFSMVVCSRPKSPATSISWMFRWTVGSATIVTLVRSTPIPARLNDAETLMFAGKP